MSAGTGRRREVGWFLVVGGAGYVVDLATFNLLLSTPGWAGRDPALARIPAVVLAVAVTYLGNRFLTWRQEGREQRPREVALYVVLNVVGMAISVATLVISHDVLHLTSRLADNISGNVVGVLLGTLFRYWSYRRFVFTAPPAAPAAATAAPPRADAGSKVPPGEAAGPWPPARDRRTVVR